MKKSIFEKFRAKSLSNENQKSILGGDFNQCLAICMGYQGCEYPYSQPIYPCCRAFCLGEPMPPDVPCCSNDHYCCY